MAAKMAREWEGVDKDAFIVAFFKKMFATHPEWRPRFHAKGDPDPSKADWKHQFDITRDALDKIVKLAGTDTNAMKAECHKLAQRHVSLNVGQTEFQEAKSILAAVVKDTVPGADMAAWTTGVTMIIDALV